MVLKRGKTFLAHQFLTLCKMLDKKMWYFQHPLRQFQKRVAYANAHGTDFQVPTNTVVFLSDTDSEHTLCYYNINSDSDNTNERDDGTTKITKRSKKKSRYKFRIASWKRVHSYHWDNFFCPLLMIKRSRAAFCLPSSFTGTSSWGERISHKFPPV